MRWPTMRAMMSLGPPAGNGTISLIGFAGKSCAVAACGNSSIRPVTSAQKNLTRASPRINASSRVSNHQCPTFAKTPQGREEQPKA
jgi:hypothetical protein